MKLIWWLEAIIYVPFLLLSMVLAPILPLSAIGKQRLPCWLSWFMTPDNDFPGDKGWSDTYINRVRWLLRNPAYGFAVALSHKRHPNDLPVRTGTVNGYRIDFKDGSWERTEVLHGLKFRTGWLVGGLDGMFLLSIRINQ